VKPIIGVLIGSEEQQDANLSKVGFGLRSDRLCDERWDKGSLLFHLSNELHNMRKKEISSVGNFTSSSQNEPLSRQRDQMAAENELSISIRKLKMAHCHC